MEFFNSTPISRSRLNDTGVILVNVIFAWTAYLISALFNVQMLWLALGLAGVT